MAVNLGQVAAIVLTDVQPTNQNILWKLSTEDIPRYFDNISGTWLPLNTLGATQTMPEIDPIGVPLPPAGNITFGWHDGDLWWMDETGNITYNSDGRHAFYTVATLADRNALPDVKAQDRVIVTSEGDTTLNGEYEARIDNPSSTQWTHIPVQSWTEAPVDGTGYLRKDVGWEQGYTRSEIDGLNTGFIRVDGTNDFIPGYTPTNDESPATKKYIDDELLNKEDYLGTPAANGYILSSNVADVRTWIPVPADTDSFINLTDTPSAYTGSGGEFVRVKVTEDGLIFSTIPPSATTFLALTDTPFSYLGSAGQVPVVNATENALEFITLLGGGNLLSDGSIPMDGAFTPTIPRHLVYKEYVDDADALKEDGLGNPPIDGYHLASTAAGVRFWEAPFGGDFLDLGDTPATYAGAINYNVVVNGSGTGLTFQVKANPSNIFTGLTDTPSNYVGHANKVVAVNATENGLFFTTASTGNLLSDGSVPMDAGYTPTANLDIATKEYVDANIGSGNLLSDGSIPMDVGYVPTNPQDIATYQSVEDWAGLIRVDEGTPTTKTGWRFRTQNLTYHGDIGTEAVDMMFSTALIADRGAVGDYSVSMNEDTLSSGRASLAVNRLNNATGNFSVAAGHETRATGICTFTHSWGQTITPVEARAHYSAILGGQRGVLDTGAEGSVMLSGDAMSGNMPYTVYVPSMKFEPRTTDPVNPEEGAIYYNTTEEAFFYFDGLVWRRGSNKACVNRGLADLTTIPIATPDDCDYYTATEDGDYLAFDPPTGGLLGVTIGDRLAWNGSEWVNLGNQGGTFVGLADTPSVYTGAAGRQVVVNATETGLEFGTAATGGATFTIPVGTLDGFAIGDPMHYNSTSGDWELADSSGSERTAQGIISSIEPSSAICTIYGEFQWAGHGFTPNTWYYLDITAGNYTVVQPATGLVQLAFFVLDADNVYAYVPQPVDANQIGGGTFLGLGDTPNDYTGQAGRFAAVNVAEDALEFIDPPSLTQGWGSYQFSANTGVDPLTGTFTTDNADVTLVTTVRMHYENQATTNVSGFLKIVATGSFISFVDDADPNNTLFYQVNSVNDVPASSYVSYDVTHVSDSGTITINEFFTVQNQAGQPDLITQFTGLQDTPSSYTTEARKTVRVNEDGITVGDGDALEFVTVGGNLGQIDELTTPTDRPVYGDFYIATNDADYTLFDPPTGGILGVLTGDKLAWNGAIWVNEGQPVVGATTFIGLTDTPLDYTGVSGQVPVVNITETALVFENKVSDFLDLTDSPTDYIGQAGRVVRVNLAETGVEFTDNIITFIGLLDTPLSYLGNAGLVPVVNTAEDALEFEAKIEEPTADGLWVRKVTDTATTPVYSWSEELDGGTF